MPTGGFAQYESDGRELLPAWQLKMGIRSYLGCLIPCMSPRVVRTHDVVAREERALSPEAAARPKNPLQSVVGECR